MVQKKLLRNPKEAEIYVFIFRYFFDNVLVYYVYITS